MEGSCYAFLLLFSFPFVYLFICRLDIFFLASYKFFLLFMEGGC